MIYKRLSFIIICSVLSNITINSSWATTSNEPSANLPKGITVVSSNQNSADQKEQFTRASSLEHHDQIVQSEFVNQSEPKLDSTSSESSSDINRFWFFVAMAVTSTLYLWLIWILFRKPLPKNEVVSILADAKEQSDKSTAMDDVSPFETVKEEEMISPQVSSEIDLKHTEASLDQEEPALAETNASMVDQPSPRSNVVKINSDNNYIDVGFELIQDLQQSDRNTRRKAIWDLAKIGDSRCIEPLIKLMPQANPVDKSLIVKAVTQITDRSFRSVNQQLLTSLKHANPQTRINAILDLTAFYKFVAPINHQLTQMQLDPDPEVRHRAQQALEKLNFTNFPAAAPMINNYSGHPQVNQNGNMTSEDKDKANQI